MRLVDTFFDTPVAAGVSALVLLIIGLLLKENRGRRWVLGLSLLLYVRYMVWRALYTLPTDDVNSITVGWIVFLAELYGLCQFCFFTYQSWSPTDRSPAPITTYPTVDILVTVVNEPLSLLRQTVMGCLSQEYPKDRFKVYVLDDGHRLAAKQLATALGCGYIRRPDYPRHAKAGNLNHALHLTDGDLVAVFDVDHIPARTFLKETIGFFDDPKVAIVQTPHHFYNPDIFQRNLRIGDLVKNEQALFFRSLQAGRDAHNSAFFAGSGGLFRRQPLEEIGGFQTQTITEDIHTSMNLHAQGYTSCYLNRVLSAGLMPETFEGYLKQRKRWAIGCIQMLLRDNPLTKRGLTLSQRLDYFGSIFYFFFGLPRIICLIAPLSSLLFHTPPIQANVMLLGLHFFSFYIAAALAMRPVSSGSRNPFWSGIYEIAMCFALSAVALSALVAPHKERPFEVTPKGQRIEKNTSAELMLAWPHLLTFGLLIAGVMVGIRDLRHGTGDPGLPVSLLWGCVNLALLTIAMFVANEQTQGRRAFRLNRDFVSEVFVDDAPVSARILNINEHGAALSLEHPLFTALESVSLLLTSSQGAIVRLTGRLIRQERLPSGDMVAALQFIGLDRTTRHTLVDKIFGDPAAWEESYRFQPGIASSLRSLLVAVTAPWRSYTWERRRIPRILHETSCRLSSSTSLRTGRLKDMSYTGVSVLFSSAPKGSLVESLLELPRVALTVSPVSITRRFRKTYVRFRVERIERGEQQWRELHDQQWREL
ncbi:MAG: glycosyltransferase [Nitrospira sp. BO4]|jgi:cellulose synthase (UDP-forming)|nr:glycosyltransferase [Nitrospira sp. BO4]